MKSKKIFKWLPDCTRILFRGGVVALALLSVGLWAVSVSADPVSSPRLLLPTRPASPKRPTSVPPPQSPGSPSDPSAPGLPSPSPTATPAPTPVPTPSVDLTFEELGYDTFQLSESGSTQIELHLPRYFLPNNDASYLDLTIAHVPPEPDKLSVVRLTLNRAPLAVIPLSPENAEPTTYRFYLANTPLTPGRNELDVTLDTGAVCNVRGARVDVVVYGESAFHLEYSLSPPSPELALYPAPFFERSFEHEPVYVVLPQNPSITALSAAATIAAGLGKFSNGEIRLASAMDTEISTDIRNGRHLIVVGKNGSNRLLDRLNLSPDLARPSLSTEEGVIQELLSPWNPQRMILVVAGGGDEGLGKASQALNREAHLSVMQGSVVIVDTMFPLKPTEDRQPDADFTLADLGYEEGVVYGSRPHAFDYSFYMPWGFAITEEPRFTLYFAHARIASPANSSLDVHFNGVPLRSVLLDGDNADEGELEVTLPSWLIRPGLNEIHVSIEMNLDDEDKCLFLDSQHLWTTIYSHSYFHLPFISQDVDPSLDMFPYPFNERPSLSGLLLVLPDRPGQFDYDLMLGVAAELGAADQGDFLVLDAMTADLVTQESRQGKDLILIGRPSAHSLIAALNDDLPQPFESGSDRLHPQVESAVFVQDPSRDIGLIEELAAPWDADRTILVLTGTTDEGVGLAARALSRRDALSGDVVLVEESVGIRAVDTRSLLSKPGSEDGRGGANRALLIQLGERWW